MLERYSSLSKTLQRSRVRDLPTSASSRHVCLRFAAANPRLMPGFSHQRQMRPPKLIKPDVVRFCRTIVPEAVPVYVPVIPIPEGDVNNCFSNVEKNTAQNGGKQIIGWAVWERPSVLIEAEFHSIWLSPSGELIDITPKQMPMPRILFFTDPRREYKGVQVDNIRKPLKKDRDVEHLCDFAHRHFKNINTGELAKFHGKIRLTGEAAATYHELEKAKMRMLQKFGRNPPEPGGYSRPAGGALHHGNHGEPARSAEEAMGHVLNRHRSSESM